MNSAIQFVRYLTLILLGIAWLTMARGERFDYHSIRRTQHPASPDGRYEGESHYERHGNARVQGMRHYGTQWSGDAHFLWDGAIGDEAKVRFRVERASRYQLTVQLTRAVDYGMFQVSLDEEPLPGEVDLFSSRVELAPILDFGEITLDDGPHTLTFKLTGGNERAKKFRGKAFLLGLDYFQLVDLDPPPAATDESSESVETHINLTAARTLLNKYCSACHQGEDPKGDIDLAKVMQTESALLGNVELIESIADALAFGNMPPEDEPPPTTGERERLVRYFRDLIDRHVQSADRLEPVVMRRMTRYEYNNAVRDLLQLRGDIYPLPERTLRAAHDYYQPETGILPDVIRVGNRTLGKNQVERQILDGVSPFAIDLQAEHGFNNRGDQLSVSPILLESFVQLGESIVSSRQFAGYCNVYPKLFVGTEPANPTQDLQTARERLLSLLQHAFRQPVSDETLDRYHRFFALQYQRSDSFTESMKKVVAAILASPRFLYFSESKRESRSVSKLDDYELATRLSLFLWSTIPDRELLQLAQEQRLSESDVLEQQIQRLLLDKQSQALSENFARQWLRIDPLGFVLENYDAVGRWRDNYRSGLAIDASGKLFGDAEFQDIESFKDVLLDRPEIFIRAFTEHLLSYALGRKLNPSDKPAIDRIVRRVEADHGRFSTVVLEIAKSRPFRHKTNQQRRPEQ